MSTPLRVLIVEDSENDAILVLRVLRQSGYEPAFERVDTAEAMAHALRSKTWDVVLADHNMPNFDSLSALMLVKRSGIDAPFIIVSGTIGENTAVAAMRFGAHDYIMKEKLARLGPAVERELGEAEDEERRLHRELQEQHRQLEQRVREVTALNRLFQEHISQRFELAHAYRELLDGLQQLGQQNSALVERARSNPIPDLQDVPGLHPEGDANCSLGRQA